MTARMSQGLRPRRWVSAIAIVGIAVLTGTYGYGWAVRARLSHAALHADKPEHRAEALRELYRLRDLRAAATMKQALANDADDSVREAAAYALHKIEAPGAADAIAAAVERQPDNIFRAKMVTYLVRLRGASMHETLRVWSGSEEIWRSTGAALGRLELGDAEAAPLVFDRLAGDDAFVAAHITDRLRPLLETMMELIGRRIDLSGPPGQRWSTEQVAAIRTWWRQHATATLLGDAAERRRNRGDVRRQLARLGGAQRRATRYLGLN